MNYRPPALNIMQYPGAEVIRLAENSWRLEISACTDREYRLAQLDDHKNLKRSEFRWKPPASLKLKARVSAEHLPGTWGFGFWNYPFTILLSGDLKMQGLPTLPEAIWYFHASSHNYLSFRNDLPATGFLASTFSSKKVPTALLLLASPALALTLTSPTAQLIRWLMRQYIQEDASTIHSNPTEWHEYKLVWEPDVTKFSLDGIDILQTNIVSHPPLSLVIWIDNQYAALPPAGRLRYGNLPNPEPAWMEIQDIELQDEF